MPVPVVGAAGHDVLRIPRPRSYSSATIRNKERLFNPYTGSDLGDYITRGERWLIWLTRLHDDLLLERSEGPWWNGLLSLVFTVIVLSGGIVWWPGISRWKRSLRIKATSGWRRFNWDLHSVLGFWLFFFMVMWGITGWYLGIPDPLTNLVERLSDPEGPSVSVPAILPSSGCRVCTSDAGGIRLGGHG